MAYYYDKQPGTKGFDYKLPNSNSTSENNNK